MTATSGAPVDLLSGAAGCAARPACLRLAAVAAVLFCAVASSDPAAACTLCHGDLALAVRHRLMAADFAFNLAGVLAPFPLLFAAVVLAARG